MFVYKHTETIEHSWVIQEFLGFSGYCNIFIWIKTQDDSKSASFDCLWDKAAISFQ